MRLENKTAVITGGGRGIGRAASLLFASEGAEVAIIDKRPEIGNSVVSEIKDAGGKAIFV